MDLSKVGAGRGGNKGIPGACWGLRPGWWFWEQRSRCDKYLRDRISKRAWIWRKMDRSRIALGFPAGAAGYTLVAVAE